MIFRQREERAGRWFCQMVHVPIKETLENIKRCRLGGRLSHHRPSSKQKLVLITNPFSVLSTVQQITQCDRKSYCGLTFSELIGVVVGAVRAGRRGNFNQIYAS